jgi:hypothetical protein
LAKREAADLPEHEATKLITKRFKARGIRSASSSLRRREGERRRPGRAAARRRRAKKPLARAEFVLK